MFYKQEEFNRSRNSEPEGTERTLTHVALSEINVWEDFTGGPVAKNLPFNAGDVGSSLVEELRSYMPWSN